MCDLAALQYSLTLMAGSLSSQDTSCRQYYNSTTCFIQV